MLCVAWILILMIDQESRILKLTSDISLLYTAFSTLDGNGTDGLDVIIWEIDLPGNLV